MRVTNIVRNVLLVATAVLVSSLKNVLQVSFAVKPNSTLNQTLQATSAKLVTIAPRVIQLLYHAHLSHKVLSLKLEWQLIVLLANLVTSVNMEKEMQLSAQSAITAHLRLMIRSTRVNNTLAH
jgi:hypothetical protein